MKKYLRITSFLFIAMLLTLFVTNPSEEAFLQKVAEDYGTMHHGLTLIIQQLAELGDSYFTSYMIMGVYTYQFGSITVSYLGVFG